MNQSFQTKAEKAAGQSARQHHSSLIPTRSSRQALKATTVVASLLALWGSVETQGADASAPLPAHPKTASHSLNRETPAELADFLRRQANRGAKTHALLVMRGGVVEHEFYPTDYTPDTRNLMFSATKSITSLAIGMALERTGGTVDQSICSWVDVEGGPEAPLCQATLRNVLQMTSGVEWKEGYASAHEESDVLRMLYGSGSANMAAYVTSRPISAEPGASFRYSSGDTMLLSAALDAMLGGHSAQFVRTELLEPLGIGGAVWERDGSGVLIGAAQSYFTAREFARFGLLMLGDGAFNGQQIVPSAYIRDSLKPARLGAPAHPEARATRQEAAEPVAYGYQWWLNLSAPEATPRWENASARTFGAIGYWGQFLIVVPEDDLIVVRFGEDKETPFNMDKLLGILRNRSTAGLQPQAGQSRLSVNLKNAAASPLQANAHPRIPSRNDAPPAETIDQTLGFAAQFYCSCLFVSGRDPQECRSSLLLDGLPQPETGLVGAGRTWARFGGMERTSQYRGQDGCRLDSVLPEWTE